MMYRHYRRRHRGFRYWLIYHAEFLAYAALALCIMIIAYCMGVPINPLHRAVGASIEQTFRDCRKDYRHLTGDPVQDSKAFTNCMYYRGLEIWCKQSGALDRQKCWKRTHADFSKDDNP